MIKNLQRTLRGLYHTNNKVMYSQKLRELKEHLKAETDLLTDQLYKDEISLPKYLVKIEKLYSHLKDTICG